MASGWTRRRRDGGSPTRVRWLVFLLAAATSWLLYLHRYAWGVIKPGVKAEFGFSDVELGWLDSTFNAAYGLFQVPTGLLGDLFGPALVLPVILLAWSCTVAATGIAAGFWSFAAVRAVFGALQAGAYPNLNKVTRNWFPPAIRTTVQGFVASLAGRAGGASSSLVMGTLLLGKLGLGWRLALVLVAGLGVLLAGAFKLFYRNHPAEHPWANEDERRLIEAGEPPPPPGAKLKLTSDLAALFSFAAFLLEMFTVAFADTLFVYWIPLFLAEAKGLDAFEMGIFASLPLWGGALGGLAGGALNDVLLRATGRRFARRIVGVTGTLVAGGLVFVSIGCEDGRSTMAVLGTAKFFGDWSQPTAWGTITDIGGRAGGTVFGAVNMAGSIGAFAAGPAIGWVKQSLGWEMVFWMVGGVYLLSGLSWLAIDPTRRLVVEVNPSSIESGQRETG